MADRQTELGVSPVNRVMLLVYHLLPSIKAGVGIPRF